MNYNIIQVEYDRLDDTASRFAKNAESIADMQSRIKQSVQSLQSGKWEGEGSSAFFTEMERDVFPVITRLTNALEQAQSVTLQAKAILQAAEEEAADRFQSDGDGDGSSDNGDQTESTPVPSPASNDINDYIVKQPKEIFTEENMKAMIGMHFPGEGSEELNDAMEKLMQNPSKEEAYKLVDKIADIQGIPRDEFRAQYDKFLEIKKLQQNTPSSLDIDKHPDFMGSTWSLRYGKATGDVFGLNPVFGSLLNPTGGMIGPGNIQLYAAGENDPVGYHGVFHDTGGYLINSHGKGPGYDYLELELHRDATDELTGQRTGIQWWLNQKQLDALGPDFIVDNMPGAREAVVDIGFDVAQIPKGALDIGEGIRFGDWDKVKHGVTSIVTAPGQIAYDLTEGVYETGQDVGRAIGNGAKDSWNWLQSQF